MNILFILRTAGIFLNCYMDKTRKKKPHKTILAVYRKCVRVSVAFQPVPYCTAAVRRFKKKNYLVTLAFYKFIQLHTVHIFTIKIEFVKLYDLK